MRQRQIDWPQREPLNHWQKFGGEQTSSPVLLSGAQQPLTHWLPVTHRAAQETPVTVELTQTVFGQHVADEHCCPAVAHDPAQYLAGAHTADVPWISTVQHPELHWLPLRQLVAQRLPLLGSFASNTQVAPLQHGALSEQTWPPHIGVPLSGAPLEEDDEDADDAELDEPVLTGVGSEPELQATARTAADERTSVRTSYPPLPMRPRLPPTSRRAAEASASTFFFFFAEISFAVSIVRNASMSRSKRFSSAS